MTHVRPCDTKDPLAYRAAISLHASFVLDAELSGVNLMNLSRAELRELMLSIETRTGLVSGVMAGDSIPEDDA